ncbi:MAG: PEP-CTERM sorting domain-containing protein [Planctomycetes bacterium]|nr:PEP-CTERM sorting domain-containing protein [Planctomycetota bacterium]
MSQTSKFLPLSLSVAVAIALTIVASPARAVTLWNYNVNGPNFVLSANASDGATDWENQQATLGEGWTIQGSSTATQARGAVTANPYTIGPLNNIIRSRYGLSGNGYYAKAWHGYATGGSGNVAGNIQPLITDMATADLINYTFDVRTPNADVSGSGNHTQWTLGSFSAPGSSGSAVLFKIGREDPFANPAGGKWRLYTGSGGGTVTEATKSWAFDEHLTVDVLIDLVLNTLSVEFNGVADVALTNVSLGLATPRTADEIYFDLHGGEIVSLQVETSMYALAAVPEPNSIALATLALAGLGVCMVVRRFKRR